MSKLEQASKPSTTFISFIYKDERVPRQTVRNMDIAIAILDADHENIKTINWNGVRFTVEELLESNF